MDYPHSPSAAMPHPLYAMLAAFPVACFSLTLLTDIAFWQSSNLMWQNFSAWLLFAGLVFGGLAALVRVLEFVFRPEFRFSSRAWLHAVVGIVVLGLAVLNSLVHSGDGWTAVVPNGLILSAVTVVVMLIAAWLGRPASIRYGAEASNVYG